MNSIQCGTLLILAACAAACGSPSLDGSWSFSGVDTTQSMVLQGTPNDIHGTGSFTGLNGIGSFTVQGDDKVLTLTGSTGPSNYSVFFIDANDVYLEIEFQEPVSGSCHNLVFHPEECTGTCLDPASGGSPGGYCFERQ